MSIVILRLDARDLNLATSEIAFDFWTLLSLSIHTRQTSPSIPLPSGHFRRTAQSDWYRAASQHTGVRKMHRPSPYVTFRLRHALRRQRTLSGPSSIFPFCLRSYKSWSFKLGVMSLTIFLMWNLGWNAKNCSTTAFNNASPVLTLRFYYVRDHLISTASFREGFLAARCSYYFSRQCFLNPHGKNELLLVSLFDQQS
jgi:hypothetical protein